MSGLDQVRRKVPANGQNAFQRESCSLAPLRSTLDQLVKVRILLRQPPKSLVLRGFLSSRFSLGPRWTLLDPRGVMLNVMIGALAHRSEHLLLARSLAGNGRWIVLRARYTAFTGRASITSCYRMSFTGDRPEVLMWRTQDGACRGTQALLPSSSSHRSTS